MSSPTSTRLITTRTSENDEKIMRAIPISSKKSYRFWLIFVSMCVCLALSALGVSSVSTALPTIADALHAEELTWVSASYALASTAFLPMSSGLAQTFGRRPAILITMTLFGLGSGICGTAQNMNMLIAGRAIQGLGGGGIQSLTEIILADLVSLQERGVYVGVYGLTWCFAAAAGPIIGGNIAELGQWRWLFYLNLPILLVACVPLVFFMDLPVPPGSYQEKFMRMDWMGNFLVFSSTVSHTLALTWGGITSSWGSARILVPLILGFVGLWIFMAYEATLAKYPLFPLSVMTNLTSISGYIQSFFPTLTTLAVVYYFPVYFEACKGASPVSSGVYLLAFSSLAITAIASGLFVQATRRYRVPVWIGWIITITTFGLMSTILATDALGKSIGYLALLGCGIGILQATPVYPIQAPLPVTQNAPAIAFMWFLRAFGCIWGITIGANVLEHELARKLPAPIFASVPRGTAITYALIPRLSTLSVEARTEVQVAFASSLAVLWRVMAAICSAGLVASSFMKEIPLHDTLDADWTFRDEKEREDRLVF